MTPMEAALLFALLVLPFHLALQRYAARLADAAYIRAQGVVIVNPRALEAHTPSMGTYMGREIWASVTFKGMVYRFSRVGKKNRVGPGELYLEPGLVYVTD